jgi:hypothetical protein
LEKIFRSSAFTFPVDILVLARLNFELLLGNMTADKFRALALSIPGASESEHMGHPDFRLAGKIFATLGYPDEHHGMVKLNAEQQRMFMRKAPGVFNPCSGAWGRQGATSVHLASAKVAVVRSALDDARENAETK